MPIMIDNMTMIDTKKVFYYGPRELSSHTNNDKITYQNAPEFRYMLDCYQLFSMQNQPYGVIKKHIMKRISELNKNDVNTDIGKQMHLIYMATFDYIREKQHIEKSLDSVMCNVSPIVPYSGVIVKPQMEHNTTIEDNDKQDIINNLSYFYGTIIDTLEECHSPSELYDVLLKYLYEYPIEILIYNNPYVQLNRINDGSIVNNILFNFVNSLSVDTISKPYLLYFVYAYIYFECNDDADKHAEVIASLKKIRSSIYGDDTKELVSVIESIISVEGVDNSSPNINSIYTNFENHIQEMAAKCTAELLNYGGPEAPPNYELDKLTSYIYNKRNFKYDKYTNSLFLNHNDSVKGYTYLDDDLMVCELNDEYLCAPVIDLSDNYKMKLILLDKEGNITLTESFDF